MTLQSMGWFTQFTRRITFCSFTYISETENILEFCKTVRAHVFLPSIHPHSQCQRSKAFHPCLEKVHHPFSAEKITVNAQTNTARDLLSKITTVIRTDSIFQVHCIPPFFLKYQTALWLNYPVKMIVFCFVFLALSDD